MFTRWKISNFKSIREPVTLDLAPLTIFSGINSSGKSTLVQSLLMVAQSFISVVDDEAVVLNGRFLQLGRLEDTLHYGHDKELMEVGFDWVPSDKEKSPESLVIHVDAKIKKDLSRRLLSPKSNKYSPYIEQAKFAFTPMHHWQEDEKVRMQILEIRATNGIKYSDINQFPPDMHQQVQEGQFNYIVVKPNPIQLVQDPRLEQAYGIALTNIVPTRLLIGIDADVAKLIDDAEWIIDVLDRVSDFNRPSPAEILQDSYLSPQISDVFRRAILPFSETRTKPIKNKGIGEFRHAIIVSPGTRSKRWVLQQLTNRLYSPGEMRMLRQRLVGALSEHLRDGLPSPSRKTQLTYQERLLPVEFMTPINQIQRVFSEKIFYLGPLRDDPRVIYAQPPLSEHFSVGLKGEFTAAKLDEYGNTRVEYPLPPNGDFAGSYETKKGKLVDGVILWLRRMGLVDKVDTEETPKIGFRLTVNSPGLEMPLDLTSVGVGVSQVLPTLVLALLVPKDSVLIFEQPELHLHPKVQSVLGDFLLAISLMGKQCLVETHSEHLINRLRRRIVESRDETVLPKLRIYFAEKEGPVSRFNQVKPNEFGSILDWPAGFFDEAENEASIILKLQMEKRRQQKNQKQQNQGKES